MSFLRKLAATTALMLAAVAAQAASVTSTYQSLGGDNWLATLTITNNGTPPSFAGFTVDFPKASNLKLVASPLGWDTIVIAEDPSIPDDGFLDSFVLDPGQYLQFGEWQGGFVLSFTLAGTPGALPFTVNGPDFEPLASGSSNVAFVPEPATAVLAVLAMGLAGIGSRRGQRRQQALACAA